ncbi:MAG: cell division protein FtsA [Bacteroidales bacterium]|jgi:cell division protein FtsA|nr:cell division protein FtsA [Bacteroidales bacterium]
MENNIVVGLDIGTTKIVAVVGERSENGKYRIIGYGHNPSEGVYRGDVINIKNTAESIKRAVEQARQTSGVDIQEVYVGIAGQHIRTFQLERTTTRSNPDIEISTEEIREFTKRQYNTAVKPGEKIIHVLPQFFALDKYSNILENEIVGMVGNQLHAAFHVVTANEIALSNIRRAITRAGLTVAGCILEPFASAESVLDSRDREVGVVLVDIGGGTTDIAIFNEGILVHTHVIPIAGNMITHDIKMGCSLENNIAEKLKVQFGSVFADADGDTKIISIPGYKNQSSREISQASLAAIIKARVQEILECVDFEIKNLNITKPFIGGIVLTGGGSKLTGIISFSEYTTGIDSRQGYANEHLEESSFSETLKDPIFATAIGLLIFGIRDEEEKEESNENKNKPIKTPGTSTVSDGIPSPVVPDVPKKPIKKPIGFWKNVSDLITQLTQALDPDEAKIN